MKRRRLTVIRRALADSLPHVNTQPDAIVFQALKHIDDALTKKDLKKDAKRYRRRGERRVEWRRTHLEGLSRNRDLFILASGSSGVNRRSPIACGRRSYRSDRRQS